MNGTTMGKTSIRACDASARFHPDHSALSTHRVVLESILEDWRQPIHGILPSSLLARRHVRLLIGIRVSPRVHQARRVLLDHETLIFPFGKRVGRLDQSGRVRYRKVASAMTGSALSRQGTKTADPLAKIWMCWNCCRAWWKTLSSAGSAVLPSRVRGTPTRIRHDLEQRPWVIIRVLVPDIELSAGPSEQSRAEENQSG